MEDTASLGLKRVWIHLLEFLICSLQGGIVNIICDAEIFDTLFELSDLFAGGGDDEVDGIDIRWFSLTTDKIYVYVWWNFNVTFRDGLEKSRLDELL